MSDGMFVLCMAIYITVPCLLLAFVAWLALRD